MVRDNQISHKNGPNLFEYYAVHFLGVPGGSVSVRHQLVRCYNVSKLSFSFRYQLWRLYDVLSWSVLLRYQLVRRYDFSNWSILFTTNNTLQRRLKYVRLINVPVATTWWRLSMVRDVWTYIRPKCDVPATFHAGWVD